VKRILLLIKGLGRGGAEQLLASSAPYFDREHFQYEIAYLLPCKDALVGELAEAGLPAHCLRGDRSARWTARLISLVRDRRFDLLHAHSPVPAIAARLGFPRRTIPPIVYTEHNVWERYHRATFWANALTFWRNDHVITVSERVRTSIRYPAPLQRLPMPPIETCYQGIDLSAERAAGDVDGVRAEFGIPAGAPVVGTVANFKPGKGHMYLIDAAIQVRDALPDVRFLLVGQGPLETDVRRRATELDIESSFVFAGFRDDAQRIMRAFDVVAVPALHDGLSIALLEAMSLGKPAVLTRSGGNPEVVQDGKQGFVVPPADPKALAEGILALLRDEDVRARLGREASRRARDFDIRSAVRRNEHIYRELLH
jgi:glycosyltransferase involved in cell wall biosynthesis